MKRSVLSLMVMGTFALVAFAVPAKAMEPEKWQGLYVGFQTGWAGADDDYSDNIFGSDNLDIEGWINGLVGGYNFRHGQFLFGIEVDGAIVDAGDEPALCVAPPCRIDWNNLGTFRGRLGWIFGEQDQFAVYVTGGYAVSSWDANFGAFGVRDINFDGYVIGGGIEAYLFNTNWISNKIEYNYIDFSGGSKTIATGSVTSSNFEATEAHVLKFGLNIHF